MRHSILKRTLAVLLAAAAVTMPGLRTLPTHAADLSFTHKEWTGKDGTEKVFAVNRTQASVNAVPYQSTDAAIAAVWDYPAREGSDYLQMLTGPGEDWQLTVKQNDKEASGIRNSGFMMPGYAPKSEDGWRTVQLPESWTCQGFDFPIYANVIMPWQSKYDGYVPAPEAPTGYDPVGLYLKKFMPDKSVKADGRRVYIEFDGV
ncbi:MAG: hypothetical protein IKI21_03145, partial [Oscillospiraceae bacterium]|nr:hypothetical protein [Oscillospiraceae bacterium]